MDGEGDTTVHPYEVQVASHSCLEGVGGITTSREMAEVPSPLMFRRWRWHHSLLVRWRWHSHCSLE